MEMTRARSRNLRRRVWDRDRGICWICEEPVPFEVVTLDHIVPRSKGGRYVFDNLHAAHEICNRERGDHPDRTGKRNPSLPEDVRSQRRRGRNKRRRKHRIAKKLAKHRDPMTVTILDRLASELTNRPVEITSVTGEVLWLDKE